MGLRLAVFRRMSVIISVSTLLLLPPPYAPAQDLSKVWHIGLCHVGIDHEPPALHTLHQALNELGYEDGKNLRFDWRNQPDQAAAAATMKEWVTASVDLIVGFEDQCIREAKAATSDIPIVFVHIYDPQAAGYIENLARPGGNLTGPVSNLSLIAKRLELLKQIDPDLQRVLVLFDRDDPYVPRELALVRAAAAVLTVELIERDAKTAADVRRVFAGLKSGAVGAVIVASPDLQTNHPRLIIKLSESARLPVAGHRKGWVEWGALLSYAPDLAVAGPVAARYIDKILRGANPAELPVEELSEIVFTLNVRRARELGLTIPPAVLLRADEVIE